MLFKCIVSRYYYEHYSIQSLKKCTNRFCIAWGSTIQQETAFDSKWYRVHESKPKNYRPTQFSFPLPENTREPVFRLLLELLSHPKDWYTSPCNRTPSQILSFPRSNQYQPLQPSSALQLLEVHAAREVWKEWQEGVAMTTTQYIPTPNSWVLVIRPRSGEEGLCKCGSDQPSGQGIHEPDADPPFINKDENTIQGTLLY